MSEARPASPAKDQADSKAPARARRSQTERSEAMRQRLIDATLQCLQTDGYAGTTVSRIIEVAEVSRGAPLHHFSSKAALIAAAAEQLVKRIYIQMGRAVQRLEKSDDRLHDLIYTSWKEVVNQPEHVMLNELLQASQRDAELAAIIQKLWTAGYTTLGAAAQHYLEPLGEKDDVHQLMVLTQWVLRGMALDMHIVSSPTLYDRYLRLWSRVLADHLRARDAVDGPPPKPELWDTGLR